MATTDSDEATTLVGEVLRRLEEQDQVIAMQGQAIAALTDEVARLKVGHELLLNLARILRMTGDAVADAAGEAAGGAATGLRPPTG